MSSVAKLVTKKIKELEEKGYYPAKGMVIIGDVVFTSFTYPYCHLRTITITNTKQAEIINASDTSDWYVFRKHNLEQLQ